MDHNSLSEGGKDKDGISDLFHQVPFELHDMTSRIGPDPALIASGPEVFTYRGKVMPPFEKTVALRIFPNKPGLGFRQWFKVSIKAKNYVNIHYSMKFTITRDIA